MTFEREILHSRLEQLALYSLPWRYFFKRLSHLLSAHAHFVLVRITIAEKILDLRGFNTWKSSYYNRAIAYICLERFLINKIFSFSLLLWNNEHSKIWNFYNDKKKKYIFSMRVESFTHKYSINVICIEEKFLILFGIEIYNTQIFYLFLKSSSHVFYAK